MANDKELSINLRPEIAVGNYSNLAIITHSINEVILDFVSVLPGMPKAEVTNRIIMAPEHAKTLLLALQDNIRKYESQFGEIDLERGAKVPFRMGGFGQGNTGQGNLS